MLGEMERKVLQAVAQKMLITKEELCMLSDNGAAEVEFGIIRLSNMGYIKRVESIGTCFVITQEGNRALKE